MIEITRLTQASEQAVQDLTALLPQLTRDAQPMTNDRLEMVLAGSNQLFVAMDNKRIVGTALLIMSSQLAFTKAWLEDVVVDEGYRGHGLGSRLVQAVIDAAREAGAASLNLTSNPSRVQAIHMYERMGFVRRESNLFRLDTSR